MGRIGIILLKNGENSDWNSRLVTKNLMHHAGRNGEHSCVPFNLSNTSSGFMLKEVDWGRNLKLNYTSGGLNISEVDWGDHDPSTNNMNKILLSEVNWGALHDSSFFLFLVNIENDAKPKDFFTQELWGRLSEKTPSTTLRSLNHVEGKLVHHLKLQKGPRRLDHQLDQQRDPNIHHVHNMKVVTTYLTNGILVRSLCSLNSSGQVYHLRSFSSYGFNLNTISVAC